jgi:hypothetical protein
VNSPSQSPLFTTKTPLFCAYFRKSAHKSAHGFRGADNDFPAVESSDSTLEVIVLRKPLTPDVPVLAKLKNIFQLFFAPVIPVAPDHSLLALANTT